MSKTIAINAGSSSLKWQLYQMPNEEVIAKGIVERIGLNDSIFTIKYGEDKKYEEIIDINDHDVAVKMLLDKLTELNILASYDEITGVGHRVVAGGEDFKDSVVIDDEVLAKIEKLADLAPLHNPANAMGIKAFKKSYLILSVLRFLIQLSIQQCQNIIFYTAFQLNTMTNTQLVNMGHTEQATSMLQTVQQKCWVAQLKN